MLPCVLAVEVLRAEATLGTDIPKAARPDRKREPRCPSAPRRCPGTQFVIAQATTAPQPPWTPFPFSTLPCPHPAVSRVQGRMRRGPCFHATRVPCLQLARAE